MQRVSKINGVDQKGFRCVESLEKLCQFNGTNQRCAKSFDTTLALIKTNVIGSTYPLTIYAKVRIGSLANKTNPVFGVYRSDTYNVRFFCSVITTTTGVVTLGLHTTEDTASTLHTRASQLSVVAQSGDVLECVWQLRGIADTSYFVNSIDITGSPTGTLTNNFTFTNAIFYNYAVGYCIPDYGNLGVLDLATFTGVNYSLAECKTNMTSAKFRPCMFQSNGTSITNIGASGSGYNLTAYNTTNSTFHTLTPVYQTGKMQVKVVGDNIYIGSKYSTTKDLLIHFKKCMFNNLMTFYKVGLAYNAQYYPANNPDRAVTTAINTATSDNIGPVELTNGVTYFWVGGNHSYNDDGLTKTAECVDYKLYVNSCQKIGDINEQCDSVEIVVTNNLFNPYNLSSTIIIETVTYKIKDGTISVNCNHEYKSSITVKTYYGSQSMAVGNEVLYTNGHLVDFGAKGDINKLKSEYPLFNSFTQRDIGKTWYESVRLNPLIGIGNHSKIENTDAIYLSAYSKVYHKMIANKAISANEMLSWNSDYSWYLPFADNADFLIYESYKNNKTYLTINCKTVKNSSVAIPTKFNGMAFVVVEKTAGITIGEEISTSTLSINSSNSGVVILEFN